MQSDADTGSALEPDPVGHEGLVEAAFQAQSDFLHLRTVAYTGHSHAELIAAEARSISPGRNCRFIRCATSCRYTSPARCP